VEGPFHPGELEVQRRAGVLDEARAVGRIIAHGLPPGAARFLARQRLAVASSLELSGRVWASLLTGSPGFIAPVDDELLRIAARPIPGDPLAGNLAARPDLGLLVLDPSRRQRMRFNGRGLVAPEGIFVFVEQGYSNCSKYIQLRHLEADGVAGAADAADADWPAVTTELSARQQAWIGSADTFFIATVHPQGGADASHRGGLSGFVRVLGPKRLEFDDYPGNRMFNTLGNLVANPRTGLLFVDHATGDLLQLTGRAQVEPDFSIVVEIEEVRESRHASPLRFRFLEYSPANPPLSQRAAAGISMAEPPDLERTRKQ
jgi:predicted pyridoxine 5'-phosphate oxidase superfamily flavin-nucleotide-binding protein